MAQDIGAAFRALHTPSSPFVMVNVWDAGTAKMMAALGAKALATSSAAHAYVMGRPDMGGVTRDEALAHAQEIVAATDLPVQGDFENGFGQSPGTCGKTVRLAAEVGLAGICIEDTDLPGTSAYEFDLAVDRIRAAASAARALPRDFVLTARADGVLNGSYDLPEAIRRLQAFAEAGADCLYAPMPGLPEALPDLIKAVEGPVNVLVAGPTAQMSLAQLGSLGAARISIGSALARATHKVLHDAGVAMVAGEFGPLTQAMSGDEVDKFLI